MILGYKLGPLFTTFDIWIYCVNAFQIVIFVDLVGELSVPFLRLIYKARLFAGQWVS